MLLYSEHSRKNAERKAKDWEQINNARNGEEENEVPTLDGLLLEAAYSAAGTADPYAMYGAVNDVMSVCMAMLDQLHEQFPEEAAAYVGDWLAEHPEDDEAEVEAYREAYAEGEETDTDE